uniref:Cyclin-like domain-containing protein n=2 Tax=Caenorhabditis japonica TaxID=281687 RepID=A0A8R1HV17_CAEJA
MSFSNTLIKEKNGSKYGRMLQPWLFQKQDLVRDTPSRRDGISYEDELSKRQAGGVFIFDIVMQLTHGKGEHGLCGVAVTLFNRFFKFQSLKRCDYRDVAAACVFLAGKNEDSPKKLKYVVNQLWHQKFPHNKQFPSEQHFVDQCQVVTFLEEVILRTVAFDLNVDLPHQYVLKLMQHVEKGRNTYKEMVKTAYYMATEVLIVTDWSIRYSCAAIATACVNIAAYFHNIEMDRIVPLDVADTWYRFQDSSITRAEVDVMTKEFIHIYSRNPHCHVGSLKKLDPHGKVKIVGRCSSQVSNTPVSSTITASTSSSNLQKKVDLDAYKGRQKTTSQSSETVDASRQSFMPDVKSQKFCEKDLIEQRKRRDAAERARLEAYYQQQQKNSSVGNQRNTQPNSHKRPHGPEEVNGVKKSRLDYQMKFVAASSTTSSTSVTTNGFHPQNQNQQQTTIMENSSMSAYAISVSKMMSGQSMNLKTSSTTTTNHHQQQQQPSAYQQMCRDLEYKRRTPSADITRLAPSSTQQISPPDESSPPVTSSSLTYLPPPPPPPIIPRYVHEEMEDGELR